MLGYVRALQNVWIFVNTCAPCPAICKLCTAASKRCFNAFPRITCIYYAERCSLFWDNCELCPGIVENGDCGRETDVCTFLSLSLYFLFSSPFRKVGMRRKWGCIFRNSRRVYEFLCCCFFPFFFWEAMEKGGVNKFLYSLSEIIILDYWGVVEGNEDDFFFSSFFCWKILDILRIVHYNSFIKNFWVIRRKKERIAFLFKKIGNCHSFTIPLLKVFLRNELVQRRNNLCIYSLQKRRCFEIIMSYIKG